MAKKIKRFLERFFSHRSMFLLVLFFCMSMILVVRIFQLQIIDGSEYAENFTVRITKERVLKSARGNIYDVNGKLLAYNELANAVTLEDNGTYDSTREKQLALNGEIYRLIRIIESHGDQVTNDFHIIVDESGNYAFDVSEGTTRNRFRADIYGLQSIDQMTPEEATSSAEQIMALLVSSERYGLYNEDNPYTAEELAENGLPSELTKEEQLKIVIIRYQLSLTSYQKYVQVTVASNVSDETVAEIKENATDLQGVDISEDYIRVYNDAEAFGPIIGYTGQPSSDELADLLEERDDYTSSSIIGKSGIEQYMETTLQGVDGSEEVTVDNLGKVLAINEDSTVEPEKGNDVYLTIDSELQVACYQILEQRIAGILVSNIQDVKYVEDTEWTEDSTDPIPIPIYDVYNALIENSVIDIDHFSAEDASPLEQEVQSQFEGYQEGVFDRLREELTAEQPLPLSELSEELQDYLIYFVDDYLLEESGLVEETFTSDYSDLYDAWSNDGSISLQQLLNQAISENKSDVTLFGQEDGYLNSREVYNMLVEYAFNALHTDSGFSKLIYRYMIFNDRLSGNAICQLLYDQGVLSTEEDHYTAFESGSMTSYQLLVSCIESLEIKPKQLALDPCSGSIVIIDPDTGDVRALVSYPGYDNNRLANTMDTDYYYELYEDESTPFYNKATQQLTAPGSTFKPVMTAAGLTEGVVDNSTIINCNGLFGEGLVEKVDYIHCNEKDGHGDLDIISAIQKSCNVFFCTVGYRLGLTEDGVFSSDQSLALIQEYSSQFDLDKGTGIQMTESDPHVSDSLPLPSSIGQGTHQYTTTQLARYAGTLCNSGTSYSLSILDKTTDSDGNTITDYQPEVSRICDFSDTVWDTIHTGMRQVITENDLFKNYPVELYGKTGTAEESKKRASHALFIGYSHYGEEEEDIAFAVRIAFGYSSTNAMVVAKDVLDYYYNLADETEVLTGRSSTDDLNNIVTD